MSEEETGQSDVSRASSPKGYKVQSIGIRKQKLHVNPSKIYTFKMFSGVNLDRGLRATHDPRSALRSNVEMFIPTSLQWLKTVAEALASLLLI